MTEESSVIGEKWERPTGSAALTLGGALLLLGVIAGLIWIFTDPLGYLGEIDPAKLEQKFWAGVVAAGSISAGATTAAVGYIVRAIYFLPGDDKKPAR